MWLVHTVAMSVALVLLLLAALRFRQYRRPAPLLVGLILMAAGQVFGLATVVVGVERINDLLEGTVFENDDSTTFRITDIRVSQDYMLVQQSSHLLGQIGMIVFAIGFMMLVGRIIRARTGTAPPP